MVGLRLQGKGIPVFAFGLFVGTFVKKTICTADQVLVPALLLLLLGQQVLYLVDPFFGVSLLWKDIERFLVLLFGCSIILTLEFPVRFLYQLIIFLLLLLLFGQQLVDLLDAGFWMVFTRLDIKRFLILGPGLLVFPLGEQLIGFGNQLIEPVHFFPLGCQELIDLFDPFRRMVLTGHKLSG